MHFTTTIIFAIVAFTSSQALAAPVPELLSARSLVQKAKTVHHVAKAVYHASEAVNGWSSHHKRSSAVKVFAAIQHPLTHHKRSSDMGAKIGALLQRVNVAGSHHKRDFESVEARGLEIDKMD